MLAASLQAGIKTVSGGTPLKSSSSSKMFTGISRYCRECHQARHQLRHQIAAVKTPITFKTATHSNIQFLFKRQSIHLVIQLGDYQLIRGMPATAALFWTTKSSKIGHYPKLISQFSNETGLDADSPFWGRAKTRANLSSRNRPANCCSGGRNCPNGRVRTSLWTVSHYSTANLPKINSGTMFAIQIGY